MADVFAIILLDLAMGKQMDRSDANPGRDASGMHAILVDVRRMRADAKVPCVGRFRSAGMSRTVSVGRCY